MPTRTTTTRHSRVNGLLDHDADFLKRVAAREGQAHVTKRPTPLTVQQHAKHRRTMESVCFIKPRYAAETEVNVSGIFGKWKRFVAQPYRRLPSLRKETHSANLFMLGTAMRWKLETGG